MAVAKLNQTKTYNVTLNLSVREAFILQHLLCQTNCDYSETGTPIERDVYNMSVTLQDLGIEVKDGVCDMFEHAYEGLRQREYADDYLDRLITEFDNKHG